MMMLVLKGAEGCGRRKMEIKSRINMNQWLNVSSRVWITNKAWIKQSNWLTFYQSSEIRKWKCRVKSKSLGVKWNEDICPECWSLCDHSQSCANSELSRTEGAHGSICLYMSTVCLTSIRKEHIVLHRRLLSLY